MMTTDPRIVTILQQILNPEDLGLASSAELRDVIRFALGRSPVETDLVAYFPAGRSKARSDVLAERARQQLEENYSASHDDRYFPGVLARAAACYADTRLTWLVVDRQRVWPFDHEYYKPRSNRENWVRAAALLIAEIERSDRADQAAADIKPNIMKLADGLRDENGEIPGMDTLIVEKDRPPTFGEEMALLLEKLTAITAPFLAALEVATRSSAPPTDTELLDFLDRHADVSFSFDRASIEIDVPEGFEGANKVREIIQAAKELEDNRE